MAQRIDGGRIIAVPLLVGAAYLNAVSVVSMQWQEEGVAVSALVLLSRLATLAFYCLIVFAYLRRRPALATSPSVTAYAAALAASFLPFGFPLLGYHPKGALPLLVADTLMVAGTLFAVWGIRHLDRSFSIIPQARAVVTSGPYRWVRHPLYAGELAAAFGLALLVGSPAGFLLWVVLVALQLYRAHHEELVLAAHLPDYAAYASRTGQLIPGVGLRRD